MSLNVIDVSTLAFQDQKPGTSGLRKKVSVFKQPSYAENFIQAILEANSFPKTLVVGGDGRYLSREIIIKIINVCAANGVQHLIIPKGGILSTPAASALIRSRQFDGGIILTASHNPGGENGDFGIKYNISNGGPAPESVTNKIYEVSKNLKRYKSLLKTPKVDLGELGTVVVANMKIEIVDPVDNYLSLMRDLFDFDWIESLFKEGKVKIIADSMNGVTGPYAKRILIDELGAPDGSVINFKPLPDFGGLHPDPNLTYAKGLVEKLTSQPEVGFGVAFDGDGDRYMILGQEGFFVSPGDSLAIIADNIDCLTKQFKGGKLVGVARSFPTSRAIDHVVKQLNYEVNFYETPTGWKYFGNLLDKNLISLCGEESFGTGSDHIREKDGLWACLAWLSIMAKSGKTVKQIVEDHWQRYGRDLFARHDYEECDLEKCEEFMKNTGKKFERENLIGRVFELNHKRTLQSVGNFQYTDPVDKSVTSNQGLFMHFDDKSRIIIRMSGTGSSNGTVRLYFDVHLDSEYNSPESAKHLDDLVDIVEQVTEMKKYLQKEGPTVIT